MLVSDVQHSEKEHQFHQKQLREFNARCKAAQLIKIYDEAKANKIVVLSQRQRMEQEFLKGHM